MKWEAAVEFSVLMCYRRSIWAQNQRNSLTERFPYRLDNQMKSSMKLFSRCELLRPLFNLSLAIPYGITSENVSRIEFYMFGYVERFILHSKEAKYIQ